MKKRELVYEILKLALGEDLSCGDGLANVTPQDWDWPFKTLSMHGLGAFAYSAIEKLPQTARPPKEVLLKFISINMSSSQAHHQGCVEAEGVPRAECCGFCLGQVPADSAGPEIRSGLNTIDASQFRLAFLCHICRDRCYNGCITVSMRLCIFEI